MKNLPDEGFVVYTIVNRKTGQQYHGQTQLGVKSRFRQHIADAAKSSTKLSKAIRKHGAKNFELLLRALNM
jgi:hypothetical protein